MKALIQRVTHANVVVDNETVGAIEQGLLVFLGVEKNDDQALCEKLIDKILNYRVFADDDGRMNLSLNNIQGELLIVSQFTLAANTKKGTRPSFASAGEPATAKTLYEHALSYARTKGVKVEAGIFAADMQVSLCNDGPVTFLLEV